MHAAGIGYSEPHNVGLGDRADLSFGSVGLPFDSRDLNERTRFELNPSPCRANMIESKRPRILISELTLYVLALHLRTLLGSSTVTVRARSRLPDRRML